MTVASTVRAGSSQLRPFLFRRVLVPVVLVIVAMLMVAGAGQAALPPKGLSFAFHDHQTEGKNWHVEFVVSAKTKHKLTTLVAYSEECSGTVAKFNVPISDAGVVAAGGALPGKAGGTWAVNATFQAPKTLVGTMRMTRPGCDTGVFSYPSAITGDGLGTAHNHGAKYPDFTSASPHQRAQARALQVRVIKAWRGVTVAQAAKRGYFRNFKLKKKLGLFHVYNQRYEHDKKIFDARRPESMVFWRNAKGPPVALGPMFRVPPGRPPSFAGPIPIYHSHNLPGTPAKNQMTHVWIVKGFKTAWYNCLPVKQLQEMVPGLHYVTGHLNNEHIGGEC